MRLAFHDAGEFDLNASDLFGPDGCLAQVADSAGLIEANSLVNTFVEPIWQSVCDRISRADFWVLFGKLVLEKAATVSPIFINYQFGRKDNVACNAGAGRLPNAQGDLGEFQRVFVNQMGLTLNNGGMFALLSIYIFSIFNFPMLCAKMFSDFAGSSHCGTRPHR